MNVFVPLDAVFILLDTCQHYQCLRVPSMDIMTPEEVAKVLKVTPETIRKWLRKGELTGADTPAGWRVTPADIEAWMAKHRRKEPEPTP